MERKETILDLYDKYANEIYKISQKELDLLKEISNIEYKLNETFKDEQRQLFDEIQNLMNQKSELINKQTFTFAYSLASRLCVEALSVDIEKV